MDDVRDVIAKGLYNEGRGMGEWEEWVDADRGTHTKEKWGTQRDVKSSWLHEQADSVMRELRRNGYEIKRAQLSDY